MISPTKTNFFVVINASYSVRGKLWSEKILLYGAQFANFSLPIPIMCNEITEDLPPKIFASLVMVRQNFHPPIFSHVWNILHT